MSKVTGALRPILLSAALAVLFGCGADGSAISIPPSSESSTQTASGGSTAQSRADEEGQTDDQVPGREGEIGQEREGEIGQEQEGEIGQEQEGEIGQEQEGEMGQEQLTRSQALAEYLNVFNDEREIAANTGLKNSSDKVKIKREGVNVRVNIHSCLWSFCPIVRSSEGKIDFVDYQTNRDKHIKPLLVYQNQPIDWYATGLTLPGGGIAFATRTHGFLGVFGKGTLVKHKEVLVDHGEVAVGKPVSATRKFGCGTEHCAFAHARGHIGEQHYFPESATAQQYNDFRVEIEFSITVAKTEQQIGSETKVETEVNPAMRVKSWFLRAKTASGSKAIAFDAMGQNGYNYLPSLDTSKWNTTDGNIDTGLGFDFEFDKKGLKADGTPYPDASSASPFRKDYEVRSNYRKGYSHLRAKLFQAGTDTVPEYFIAGYYQLETKAAAEVAATGNSNAGSNFYWGVFVLEENEH